MLHPGGRAVPAAAQSVRAEHAGAGAAAVCAEAPRRRDAENTADVAVIITANVIEVMC